MPHACPHCGKQQDAVTDAYGEASPKPGDLGVCFTCGGLMIFVDDDRIVRAPTDEERAYALSDPKVERLVGMILTHKAVD